MALSLQLGFPDVPQSITNPNVKSLDALDNNNPMSFLTFIKIIKVSFEPDSLQEYYNFYIKTWNNKINSKEIDDNAIIVDSYRDFIRDISLNYTTPEEKQFLSNIDFNDPYDLDVVIGFYGKKLKELALFYNSKRNDVKFSNSRNKLRGTNFGTEKTIFELTLSYLKTLDGGKMLYNWDDIETNIEIEIEELYDTYPLYFNQTPNNKIYDNKDLDYGYDLFLKDNATIISSVLSSMPLSTVESKEIIQLLDNKRLLTKKYIATDFYYLSTGNTTNDLMSGMLFKSSNNNGNNLYNRNYPTTASTPQSTFLKTPRGLGFFKPSKAAILLLDGVTKSFSINTTNLAPNSLYFFPDPTIGGKNGEVLTFVADDTSLKRNYSSGNAKNKPTSSPNDTKYFGYMSKIEHSKKKYLDAVFDSGYIRDIKSDLNNNLFGLFKFDPKFESPIQSIPTTTPTVNLIINGHEFYDELYGEGCDFNYFLSDSTTFKETIRSGLSTYTGGLSSASADVSLFFGYFTPYHELISPTEHNITTTYNIIDGAFILNSDFTSYPDISSSDLSGFENAMGEFYYSDLMDGGIYTIDPLQRSLLVPTLSADLTQTTRTSAIEIIDGGDFRDYPFDIPQVTTTYYYNSSCLVPTEYILSSYPIDLGYALNGNIMFRNSQTRVISTLLDGIPHLVTTFPPPVLLELESHVKRFEISNDMMIIETPSYLTINRLLFENGKFVDPKTTPIIMPHNTGDFDKVSNRFKVGSDVYYCKFQTLVTQISSNNFILYPEIYKMDGVNFKHTKMFPRTIDQITSNDTFFNVSGENVRYVSSDAPTLTYNRRNNVYNISIILKDSNNGICIHEFDFKATPFVKFISKNIINTGSGQYSNILDSSNTLSMYLSSSTPIFNGEELTI